MKKNKFLRLASFMLIACLATCCAVGGTFAKYVTSATANDSARVAKWGVTVTTASNMFAANYDDTVVSTGGTPSDLVAPGTSGVMSEFDVTGTPEVDVRVSYNCVATFSGWAVTGDDFYCPIVITVKYGDNTETFNGEAYDSAAAFKDAIETHINALAKKYEANTSLNNVDSDLAISWAWAFEGNDDVKDTALGDAAAAGNASTIELKVTCTVTQID